MSVSESMSPTSMLLPQSNSTTTPVSQVVTVTATGGSITYPITWTTTWNGSGSGSGVTWLDSTTTAAENTLQITSAATQGPWTITSTDLAGVVASTSIYVAPASAGVGENLIIYDKTNSDTYVFTRASSSEDAVYTSIGSFVPNVVSTTTSSQLTYLPPASGDVYVSCYILYLANMTDGGSGWQAG
jgi:hypothetical protein